MKYLGVQQLIITTVLCVLFLLQDVKAFNSLFSSSKRTTNPLQNNKKLVVQNINNKEIGSTLTQTFLPKDKRGSTKSTPLQASSALSSISNTAGNDNPKRFSLGVVVRRLRTICAYILTKRRVRHTLAIALAAFTFRNTAPANAAAAAAAAGPKAAVTAPKTVTRKTPPKQTTKKPKNAVSSTTTATTTKQEERVVAAVFDGSVAMVAAGSIVVTYNKKDISSRGINGKRNEDEDSELDTIVVEEIPLTLEEKKELAGQKAVQEILDTYETSTKAKAEEEELAKSYETSKAKALKAEEELAKKTAAVLVAEEKAAKLMSETNAAAEAAATSSEAVTDETTMLSTPSSSTKVDVLETTENEKEAEVEVSEPTAEEVDINMNDSTTETATVEDTSATTTDVEEEEEDNTIMMDEDEAMGWGIPLPKMKEVVEKDDASSKIVNKEKEDITVVAVGEEEVTVSDSVIPILVAEAEAFEAAVNAMEGDTDSVKDDDGEWGKAIDAAADRATAAVEEIKEIVAEATTPEEEKKDKTDTELKVEAEVAAEIALAEAEEAIASVEEVKRPKSIEENSQAPEVDEGKLVRMKASTKIVNAKPTDSSSSLALIPVNEDTVQFTSGIVGGAIGFAVGGPAVGAIAAAAANYISRKEEGELHDIVEAVSIKTIAVLNYFGSVEKKYTLLENARAALVATLDRVKDSKTVDPARIEDLETKIVQVTDRMAQLNKDYLLIDTALIAGQVGVRGLGDIVEKVVKTSSDLNDEYLITDRVLEAIRKAADRVKASTS
mmetsp:Transcript_28312/g.39823  ORF Transcript_28312/g.39823 Transcript_28312/m.39823 type:complete len:780 (-) Transcript_28312:170-2509(-)